MKIAIDIDNVICNFVEAIVLLINQRLNKQFKPSDVTVWNFVKSENVDISKEQFDEILNEYIEKNMWHLQPLYADAVDVISYLYSKHSIYYITSRPESSIAATVNYFENHKIPFIGSDLLTENNLFVRPGFISFGCNSNKGKIAQIAEIDLAIDDNPKVIQSYINHGVPVVRKEEPYNEGVDYSGDLSLLYSCPNLTCFKEFVDSLEK